MRYMVITFKLAKRQAHKAPIHYVRRQTLKMPSATLFLN